MKSIYWATPFHGCPVINSVFGGLCRKTVPPGEGKHESLVYDFHLHGLLHEYFLYLVSVPPRTPEGVANLKKAICVVRRDSIIGVTL